jgi:hypothetical protein
VRAYPAAGLTGDEQGLCPQFVPRGLVYEQHHDISAVIAELGEQLIAGARGLRFGSRTLTSTRRRNIRAHCHGSIIHKALARLIAEWHQRVHTGLLQKCTMTTFFRYVTNCFGVHASH